jgi:hypothetical protein
VVKFISCYISLRRAESDNECPRTDEKREYIITYDAHGMVEIICQTLLFHVIYWNVAVNIETHVKGCHVATTVYLINSPPLNGVLTRGQTGGTHLITEVKQCFTRLVFGWVTRENTLGAVRRCSRILWPRSASYVQRINGVKNRTTSATCFIRPLSRSL